MTQGTSTSIENFIFDSKKEAEDNLLKQVSAYNSQEIKLCGDLACQHDSILKTLVGTKLVSFVFYKNQVSAAATNGKNFKKKKQAKKEVKNNDIHDIQCNLILSDSIFFPEGGGQPNDVGTLTINEEYQVKVKNVQNMNQYCVFSIEVPITTPLSILTEVKTMKQEIDFVKRRHYMTHHSAQHLLSAIAMNEYQIETHSFSLSSLPCYIDFKATSNENFHHIQELANDAIRNDYSFQSKYIDPSREEDVEFFKSHVRSRLLPSNLSGNIRLMMINNGIIDTNTCCGTHVPSLKYLQMISLLKYEQVKPAILRVYYATSDQILSELSTALEREQMLTSVLSAPKEDHSNRVMQLLEDKKKKESLIKSLELTLGQSIARDILNSAENHIFVKCFEGDLYNAAFLSSVASNVLEQDPTATLLLSVTSTNSNDNCDQGSFVLMSQNEAFIKRCTPLIMNALDGKGGGKKGKVQGKGNKVKSGLTEALKILSNEKGNE